MDYTTAFIPVKGKNEFSHWANISVLLCLYYINTCNYIIKIYIFSLLAAKTFSNDQF